MEKKIFEKPEMEIIRFNLKDAIVAISNPEFVDAIEEEFVEGELYLMDE